MIKNFVDDDYLERFYPDLVSYRSGDQADYSDQIDLAFNILLNDLQNRGLNPRQLGVPLDLNRDDSSAHSQQLTSETISATDTGYAWEGNSERRFYVNLTTKSVAGDSWTIALQGSNATSRPADGDSSWEAITSLVWAANVGASVQHVTFTQMYRWYRRVVTKNSGSGNIAFQCALYDTSFDNLIAWKAIQLIALSWDAGASAIWQTRLQQAAEDYAATLSGLKVALDSDEDGIPERPDEDVRTSVRFTR